MRSSPMFPGPSSASSSSLSSSEDSPKHFDNLFVGTHKLHYSPRQQWDFVVDADDQPIDLSLILPHYRAHNQPTGYRMSMHMHSQRGEIKSAICRKSPRSPFFLSVHSSSDASVTLYLPSDFCGTIRLPSAKQNVSFSAGFANHIRPRVHFRTSSNPHEFRQVREEDDGSMDEVEVYAAGMVTFRIWDICEGAPERPARDSWRKMVKRATSSKNLRGDAKARSQPQAIDWDFLLDD